MKLCIVEKKAAKSIVVMFAFLALVGVFNLFFADSELGKRKVPIYNVKTDKKVVAVTFDSAWGNEDLDEILNILENYGCDATFFVVGEFLDKYPDDIKKMYSLGNEIANHSDTHPHISSLSRDEMIKEMDACDKKIKNLTGQSEVLFRAPYGEYNSVLVGACEDTNRFCIQWDVDSLDWKGLTASEIQKRVVEKVQNGSIILLHNGAKNTAKALPLILNDLKNEGYEFVTVSNLIYKDNCYTDQNGTQIAK